MVTSVTLDLRSHKRVKLGDLKRCRLRLSESMRSAKVSQDADSRRLPQNKNVDSAFMSVNLRPKFWLQQEATL